MKPWLIGLLLVALLLPATGHAARRQQFSRQFVEKFSEAARAYEEGNMDKALAIAEEAEKIQPRTPLIPNLRGAVALNRKDYARAKECFEEALKLDPYFFPARYNLIEIPFRAGKYADARTMYETLLAQDPANELVQYRVFLTYVLEKDVKKAEEWMNRIRFPGDTPAYYYAHMVWELQRGNFKEAESYLRAASWVFGEERAKYFAEPLQELGWIKKGKKAMDKDAPAVSGQP